MQESILTSIKKLLGIAEEYTAFDADILMHINSVIMILRQMGIGPEEGFAVTSKADTWTDYLGDAENILRFASIRSYIFLKVRQLFDPPTSGTVAEASKALIAELEYRLYAEAHWPTTS